ncbi:MAG: hypothetical protein RBR26_08305 [Methanosarcina mazei]|nr:hypothetical protein [Methanosarcina mazei]
MRVALVGACGKMGSLIIRRILTLRRNVEESAEYHDASSDYERYQKDSYNPQF